jgi:uncharacterized damage-inducible protein DinB
LALRVERNLMALRLLPEVFDYTLRRLARRIACVQAAAVLVSNNQGPRSGRVRASELFGHWPEYRHDLVRALDCLSDDELQFVPREGLWSLGQVACHVAAAEEGWLRLVRGERLRDFPSFEAVDFPTVAAVKALLARVHEATVAMLDELDGHEVTTPWRSRHTVGWIIWHVLEHEIHHRGEIYLMIGLLGREAPDI